MSDAVVQQAALLNEKIGLAQAAASTIEERRMRA